MMVMMMMTLEFGGKKKLFSTGIVERTECKLAVSRSHGTQVRVEPA